MNLDKKEKFTQSISITVVLTLFVIFFYNINIIYGLHETPSIYSAHNNQQIGKPAKWVGYGYSQFDPWYTVSGNTIQTEVKGIVVRNDGGHGDELYLVPDQNYRNIVIEGNYLRPTIEKSCNPIDMKMIPLGVDFIRVNGIPVHMSESCKGTLDFNKRVLPNLNLLGLSMDSPIIKMEMEDSGAFGSTWQKIVKCVPVTPSSPDYDPKVDIWDNNHCKQTQYIPSDPIVKSRNGDTSIHVGDHVKVKGLWAIELQHVEWYVGCKEPFYVNGNCFGHTEFHPYENYKIESVSNLKPGDINSESHTVGAPIYHQVHYPCMIGEKCNGHTDHLVDQTEWTSVAYNFFINAPPKPIICNNTYCEVKVSVSNITKIGDASYTITQLESGGSSPGANIYVTATGSSAYHPSIINGTWSVSWIPSVPPPTTKIQSAVDGKGKVINDGGSTTSNSIKFTFTGIDNTGIAGFRCSIDTSGLTPCSSPQTFTNLVINVEHLFRVQAINTQGKVDPNPAQFSWSIGKLSPCAGGAGLRPGPCP